MNLTRPHLSVRNVAILLALAFAIGWFAWNVSLPAPQRGLTCCDGAEYVSNSGNKDVWEMAGPRLYGYPFFLSLFRRALQKDDLNDITWVTPAAITQLLAWFASAFILFRALQRSGRTYPWWGFALVLAHTSLSSYAAMTLTDSLASSLFCVAIAALVYLQEGLKSTRLTAAIAGVVLGLATSMRPSFLVISICALALVCLAVFLQVRAAVGGVASPTKRTLVAAAFFLLGFAPFYGKLLSNCYHKHGYVCMLDEVTMRRVTSEDIFRGVTAVRWWSSLTTDYRSTDDTFMNTLAGDCGVQGKVPEDAPFKWLFGCYARVPWKVPVLFLKKFVGGFDNYFFNAYATDETTAAERLINRAFSVVGFLGLIMASFHCLWALLRRRIGSEIYLLMPLAYAFAQVNSHIEPRYFMPVYPIFFLFACSQVAAYAKKPFMPKAAFAVSTLAFALFFYIQAWHWDMRDCWYNYTRIPESYKRSGLMLACPPQDAVRESLDLYSRLVPTVPPGPR